MKTRVRKVTANIARQIGLMRLGLVAVLMLQWGCQQPTPNRYQSYIQFANAQLIGQGGNDLSDFLKQQLDSLGLQPFILEDSNAMPIEGAKVIGGFGFHQAPCYAQVYEVDVIGDPQPEQMLLLSNNAGMYTDYQFYFFGHNGPAEPPFAQINLVAEDIAAAQLRHFSDRENWDLLLHYTHTPSTYLNAGWMAYRIAADTAFEIARIDTFFYDWKDYGHSILSATKLAEGEGYREYSQLSFEKADEQTSTIILQRLFKDIVLDDWEAPIGALPVLRPIDTLLIQWSFDTQTRRFEPSDTLPKK